MKPYLFLLLFLPLAGTGQSFKEKVPSLIFTALSGMSSGAGDGFRFHCDGCGPFWNGKQSWLNKYAGRKVENGPAFFGSTTFLVAVTDGPHLMQFTSTQFSSIALALAPGRKDKRFWPTVRDILIYQAAYNLPRAFVLETFFKPRIP